MQTGKMRRQITIRTPGVDVPDGMGGSTPGTPVDVGPIWSKVEPLEGNEQLRAMQTVGNRPHRFTIRYRHGLTDAQTVIYATRTFDIKSVADPEERHHELVIMTNEVTP